jgi:hypothetical protein
MPPGVEVSEFAATDGDRWWSVTVNGELATGEMHATEGEAWAEAGALTSTREGSAS